MKIGMGRVRKLVKRKLNKIPSLAILMSSRTEDHMFL